MFSKYLIPGNHLNDLAIASSALQSTHCNKGREVELSNKGRGCHRAHDWGSSMVARQAEYLYSILKLNVYG